jgi:hypothetical protein
VLSNRRENKQQMSVPGGSSPDSDSTTRRRFDFGLLSTLNQVRCVVSLILWMCEPSKAISLSLDFSFKGGDDLGTGSSDREVTDRDEIQAFNRPGVSSSSSSESTLRFFDPGEGGSGWLGGQ